MKAPKTISQSEFRVRFKSTGISKNAIFGARKALMEEVYAMGYPIYCDQSYYVQEQNLHLVEKAENQFVCDIYKRFEEWRECHYYYLFADDKGNKAWLMKGGRYD
jgi:hypothetical protein